MTTFLKLTSSSTDEKIRININKIITYVARLDRSQDKGVNSIVGSYITTIEHTLMVREKPEEIDRLLRDAYITIKESYENRIGEIPQHPINSSIDGSTQSES
jgi:hypothetical protein